MILNARGTREGGGRAQVGVGVSTGSDNINVLRAAVDRIGPKSGTTLAYTSGTTDSQSFTTEGVRDDAKTLVEASDRIEIVIDATAVEENVDDFAGYDDELVGLTAGSEAKSARDDPVRRDDDVPGGRARVPRRAVRAQGLIAGSQPPKQ